MNAFLMYRFTETTSWLIKSKTLFHTFSADSSPQVVAQFKRILNGNARWVPHLLKLCQRLRLADWDNISPAIYQLNMSPSFESSSCRLNYANWRHTFHHLLIGCRHTCRPSLRHRSEGIQARAGQHSDGSSRTPPTQPSPCWVIFKTISKLGIQSMWKKTTSSGWEPYNQQLVTYMPIWYVPCGGRRRTMRSTRPPCSPTVMMMMTMVMMMRYTNPPCSFLGQLSFWWWWGRWWLWMCWWRWHWWWWWRVWWWLCWPVSPQAGASPGGPGPVVGCTSVKR